MVTVEELMKILEGLPPTEPLFMFGEYDGSARITREDCHTIIWEER